MNFEVIDKVPYPLDDVFTTMRDKLVDLVPFLPDVKNIELVERKDLENGNVKIVNNWYAEDNIPKALKSLIKAEQLGWVDYAEWDTEKKKVYWNLEMMFFKEYVTVKGENTFTGDDKTTTITLSGDLSLDLAKHPMVPKLLAKSITKQVEKVVLALVKPNLVKVNRGIEKHLSSK